MSETKIPLTTQQLLERAREVHLNPVIEQARAQRVMTQVAGEVERVGMRESRPILGTLATPFHYVADKTGLLGKTRQVKGNIGGAAKTAGLVVLAGLGIAGALAYFGGGSKRGAQAAQGEGYSEGAEQYTVPVEPNQQYTSQVTTDDVPQPLGTVNGKPYYGDHSASALGAGGQSAAIPPRMTAANFEPADSAVQKYAGKGGAEAQATL